MKTTDNIAERLLLCIILFSTLGIPQAVGKAVLWPSNALSKVMRSDTPMADSEDLLRISSARADFSQMREDVNP